MGRIKDYIKVNGNVYWTLFDSGSVNTYCLSEVARHLPKKKLDKELNARLGGKIHKINQEIILAASVGGKSVGVDAYVIDKLGTDENGMEIQVLFGALAMQKWNIKLDLKNEKLDLTHYPREFVEF